MALCYSNFGKLYYANGQFDKALRFFSYALKIWKSFYGELHSNIGNSYDAIGTVYYWSGEKEKAKNFVAHSLRVYESIYDENHPQVMKMRLKILAKKMETKLIPRFISDQINEFMIKQYFTPIKNNKKLEKERIKNVISGFFS